MSQKRNFFQALTRSLVALALVAPAQCRIDADGSIVNCATPNRGELASSSSNASSSVQRALSSPTLALCAGSPSNWPNFFCFLVVHLRGWCSLSSTMPPGVPRVVRSQSDRGNVALACADGAPMLDHD